MTTSATNVDQQLVRDTFSQWQSEQELLDAQLTESVAALEAYQSHLDTWQRELANERAELTQTRAALELEKAQLLAQDGQSEDQSQEAIEARDRSASLTDALLARTEELRELDRLRVESDAALAAAQAREKELNKLLEAERSRANATPQPADTGPPPAAANDNAAAGSTPAASTNPVLGSVIEQFGKLRKQRSLGRKNNANPR